MRKTGLVAIICLLGSMGVAQNNLAVSGTVRLGDEAAVNATISLQPVALQKLTNENGYFRFSKLAPGNYDLTVSIVGYKTYVRNVQLADKNISLDINLSQKDTAALAEVVVTGSKNQSVSGKLKDVAGTAINAGKKTEIINLKNMLTWLPIIPGKYMHVYRD
jgi:Fe(3+) dicitrate transport protein